MLYIKKNTKFVKQTFLFVFCNIVATHAHTDFIPTYIYFIFIYYVFMSFLAAFT